MRPFWYDYPSWLVVVGFLVPLLAIGGGLVYNIATLLSGDASWGMRLSAVVFLIWGGGIFGWLVGRCKDVTEQGVDGC